jgi:hypothetical protein
MSYLGPSPRPGRRGPPRHSGPTHGARAALRWPTTHGSARLAPMADHVWPGAPLRCQAAHGPAQAGLADRFAAARMPASTGRQPANTRKQPPALAGNTPVLAGNTPALGNGQYSGQPGSTRGNWACFVRFGAWVRYLHILLARRQAWGLPRSRGSRPGRPGDCGSSHYQYWVDLTVDRAGLKTQESRRRGRQRAGAKAGARALFAGNPPCTIAIRPWRRTGSRHHSGLITAARGA